LSSSGTHLGFLVHKNDTVVDKKDFFLISAGIFEWNGNHIPFCKMFRTTKVKILPCLDATYPVGCKKKKWCVKISETMMMEENDDNSSHRP